MYSHKTKTQAHGQQNKSPAMCKTGHKHAANENTHKPRVHTRHENMKARSSWKTQATCHTAQDITWKHAADKNTNCVQHHKTHVDRRIRSRTNSRLHTHTTRQNTERTEPRHETETQDSVPGSEHHAPTRNETRHADERAHGLNTLEAVHSHSKRTWPKWQNLDKLSMWQIKPWILENYYNNIITYSRVIII